MKRIKLMKLSIIIPTLNEAEYCSALFQKIKNFKAEKEIIVVDGGSTDQTLKLASTHEFVIIEAERGRAQQLATAASASKGDFLLFLHADVQLSDANLKELAVTLDRKVELASFPIEFDYSHWFLRLNAFFSRYRHPYFHFGDQGLWISRSLYEKCGGFDPSNEILEDQDIYLKASKLTKSKKIKSSLLVSARKYRKYGVYKLQFFYYRIWLLHKMGYSNKSLAEKYRRFLAA